MRDRKGFELATNMLVVIILMLVVMGVGLTLFFNIKGQVEELDSEVGKELTRMIEAEMINSGGTVVIPELKKEVEAGDKAAFYIGIENILEVDCDFLITVEQTQKVEDTENTLNQGRGSEDVLMFDYIELDNELTIGSHERAYKKLWFNIPKGVEQGQYSFLVQVMNNYDDVLGRCSGNHDEQYPPRQMVHVVVR